MGPTRDNRDRPQLRRLSRRPLPKRVWPRARAPRQSSIRPRTSPQTQLATRLNPDALRDGTSWSRKLPPLKPRRGFSLPDLVTLGSPVSRAGAAAGPHNTGLRVSTRRRRLLSSATSSGGLLCLPLRRLSKAMRRDPWLRLPPSVPLLQLPVSLSLSLALPLPQWAHTLAHRASSTRLASASRSRASAL